MVAVAVLGLSAQEHNWPTGEYKSLGIGSMTDDMLTAWYGYEPVTYDVEILQSVDDPNFYRVLAPYGKSFADAMLKVNNVALTETQYDAAGTCVLNIDATDPDNVYFPKTMTGCKWSDDGEMYIGIPTSAEVWFKDGVFGAPRHGVAAGDDTGARAFNVRQQFRIALPGAANDFTLTIAPVRQCLITRKFEADLTVGRDVAKVVYATVPDMYEDEMDTYVDNVAALGAEFGPRGRFSYDMDEVRKETLIMVALDRNGTQVAHAWVSYYYIDDDAENWQDVGEAIFSESMLSNVYNIEPQDVKCMLQRHRERPQYLRLVSPYSAHTHWYTGTHDTHNDHNHYLYINAEYPDCIYVEESPMCMDFGHGMFRLWSFAGYFLAMGEDLEEVAGLGGEYDEDAREISFPEETLLYSMYNYENADWCYDETGATKVTLPEGFDLYAGVQDITVDADANAPVEYFNLQGVKVAQPQPGQVVIRRQGSAVSKVLSR